jgi:hypothetical protein
MQEIPRCYGCQEQVEHDPVYEAPCGHQEHPSCVFHPLCLMRWREARDEIKRQIRQWFSSEHE